MPRLERFAIPNSKIAQFCVLIVAYGGVLAMVNFIHFQWFPVHVVLYDAIFDAMVAAAILLICASTTFRSRLTLTNDELGLLALIWVLCGLLFAVTVPTIIDRSLSIYILEKLAQRGGAIEQAAFDGVFKDEYMKEQRLVDIRLTEQVNSGTIIIDKGCVRLTDRGRRIVGFTRFYRTRLLPKHREIMGKFTDDLTDPFRHSSTTVDYTCKN